MLVKLEFPEFNNFYLVSEFVNALGEPGTEDSYDDDDEEVIGY